MSDLDIFKFVDIEEEIFLRKYGLPEEHKDYGKVDVPSHYCAKLRRRAYCYF
jgi:hypothetical protein